MNNYFEELFKNSKQNTLEPYPDIVTCSECHGRFNIDECPKEREGTWEDGYYDVYICPVCEDGGWIDDHGFSPEQLKKFEEWENDHNQES